MTMIITFKWFVKIKNNYNYNKDNNKKKTKTKKTHIYQFRTMQFLFEGRQFISKLLIYMYI